MRHHHRPAVRKSKLIPAERRNPPRIRQRRVVEIVPRIQRRVAQKLENRPVKPALARPRHNIRKPRRSAPNLRRHPARTRLNLLHRVHIEVRKSRPAHLRIARVRAVHRKRRLHAALAVDGKLLRKVRRPIRVRHRPRRQQKQLAKIALIQRQTAHRLARKLLPARSRRLGRRRPKHKRHHSLPGERHREGRRRPRQGQHLRRNEALPATLDRKPPGSRTHPSKLKASIRPRLGSGGLPGLRRQHHLRRGNRPSRGIAQRSRNRLRNWLLSSSARGAPRHHSDECQEKTAQNARFFGCEYALQLRSLSCRMVSTARIPFRQSFDHECRELPIPGTASPHGRIRTRCLPARPANHAQSGPHPLLSGDSQW